MKSTFKFLNIGNGVGRSVLAVPGSTPPPAPVDRIPEPLSDKMKAGKWNPQAADAQAESTSTFKKE